MFWGKHAAFLTQGPEGLDLHWAAPRAHLDVAVTTK